MEVLQEQPQGASSRRKQKMRVRKASRPHPYSKEEKMKDVDAAKVRNDARDYYVIPFRHKREYKETKKQADTIREQKKRLGKKDSNAKASKKEMGQRAKAMLQDLADRHARETSELEARAFSTMTDDASSMPILRVQVEDVPFAAALAAASNSPFPKPEYASLMTAVRQAQALSVMTDSTSPSSSPGGYSLPFSASKPGALGMQFKS